MCWRVRVRVMRSGRARRRSAEVRPFLSALRCYPPLQMTQRLRGSNGATRRADVYPKPLLSLSLSPQEATGWKALSFLGR